MHRSIRRCFRRTCSLALMTLLGPFAGTILAQEPTSFERGWQSGRPATITGVYTSVYADDFARGEARRIDMVRDEQTGELFRVRYERNRPSDLQTGQRVQISGRAYGSGPYGVEFFVAGCCDGNTTDRMSLRDAAINGTNAISSGDQRVLVIMANFSDATLSWSVDQVTNAMFTDPSGASVNALYRDNSRGQLSISGSVVGPFTIPYLSTQCAPDAWGKAAEAAATNAGVDVASFPHRVYVLPTDSCPAAGLGTVGGNPSYAWILTYTSKGVYAHEFGHNLGMDHAATAYDGQVIDLGDTSDPMASSGTDLRGLNAPHRHQLAWGTPQLITQSGTYDLAPLAQDPTTITMPQIYVIAKPDTNEFYYLSTRSAQGHDSRLQPFYLNGLAIHRYNGKVLPSLSEVTKTYLMTELTDGQQYTDPVNGITISQVAHDAMHVTARVEFACIPSTPSLSLSPQSQGRSAGLPASYTVSVTNRDAAACPVSAFSLSAAVPSGWSTTLSPTALTLAPGMSGQAVLTVASAPGTPPGTYISKFRAAKAAQPSIEASADATYTVQPAGDTTPPSAPSGLTASFSQKLKQIQLSWTPASDNAGVAGYQVLRNGNVVGTSTGPTWSDSAYSFGTTYSYSVIAYDAAGNLSAPSSSVTFTVPGGGSGGGKKK